MQNISEFKEYANIDTDFSDWDDDFLSENVQFSDVENKLQSQQLIKNLKSTNNRIGIQSGIYPIRREVSCNRNVASSKWKEINLILQKEQKATDIFSQNKVTSCIRKHPDENSDSEDFCTPKKKRKKTEIQSIHIFVKQDKTSTRTDGPINLVNNKIDSISVIEVPLEEMSKSQNEMITSSQSQGSKMSICSPVGSQKEVNTAGSQENYSQISLSPVVITSSQESLGNKIMNISINSNDTSQSGTHIDITPPINSEYQQEEVKHLNTNDVNTQKLKVYHQNSSSNNTVSSSSNNVKAGFPEKNKFAEKCSCSVSDASNRRSYNKEQKIQIWNVRKRELKVTKRENDTFKREKLLDAREANIQKREEILQARERKYFAKIKNQLQKRGIKIKKLKKRLCVLEDDTNSFNTGNSKRVRISPYDT